MSDEAKEWHGSTAATAPWPRSGWLVHSVCQAVGKVHRVDRQQQDQSKLMELIIEVTPVRVRRAVTNAAVYFA